MKTLPTMAVIAGASLALGAPAAQAMTGSDNGVTASNEAAAGSTTFKLDALSPASTKFLFVDTDADGKSDVSVIFVRGTGATTVSAKTTLSSAADCQQVAGPDAAPITGATTTSDATTGGASITLPNSLVGNSFTFMALPDGPMQIASDGFACLNGTFGGASFTDLAPAAPSGLTATAASGVVVLDWADSGEADMAGYKVYRRAGTTGGFQLVATPSSSALTDSGLANGTTYTYYLRSSDRAGNLSAESLHVAATPQAPATAGVTEQPTGGEPAGTPTTDTPVITPVARLAEAKPAVKIKARAPQNGDPSKPAAKRARVAAITPHAVRLALPAHKPGVKYSVYRRAAHAKWIKLVTTAKGSFTDRHLKSGTRYDYRLVAVRHGKAISSGSTIIQVKTPKARSHR